MLGFGKGKKDDKAKKKKGGKDAEAPEEEAAPPVEAAPDPEPPPPDAPAEAPPPIAAPPPEAKAALRGTADASPLAETAAAIEAARKAAGEVGKGSVAFGAAPTDAPAEEPPPLKKKKKKEEEEQPPEEDEFAPKRKKLPLQPIFQGAAALFYLIVVGVVAGLVLTTEPPPPLPGHLVEFEMPAPGRGFVGMQGAPGVAPPPEPEYAALEPISQDLMEESPHGYIPKISEDGRESWKHYAGRFKNPEKRPRIAIVFMNMGLNRVQAEATIGKVPAAVAFAFQPYARETERFMDMARSLGHETFIQIPLEPSDHPNSDPGPHVLLTKLSGPDNIYRLEWALSRSPGFVGVTYDIGDKFVASDEATRPVLEFLKARGLMILEPRTAPTSVVQTLAKDIGLPISVNDVLIDRNPAKPAIDRALAELERLALKDGFAVGMTEPNPAAVERILAWVPTLKDKGILLAPASALAWRAAGS